MRIAILGGTFNPPHIGHLILIEELLVRGDFQEVLVIPANIPPHKTVQEDPGPQMRLALLDASIQGWPHVVIEDCELKRTGPSYSVDTLEQLWNQKRFDEKPALIIGDDLAADFMTAWKDPMRILQLADIVIAHRRTAAELSLEYPHYYLENLLIPISSTLIRERIQTEGAWKSLVVPQVRTLIEYYGLYRSHTDN